MFVGKLYMNEESEIVRNYKNEQPQYLLSLRTFLWIYSCLPSSVRSIVTERRAA